MPAGNIGALTQTLLKRPRSKPSRCRGFPDSNRRSLTDNPYSCRSVRSLITGGCVVHSRCACRAHETATPDSEMKDFDYGTNRNGTKYPSSGDVDVADRADIHRAHDVQDARGAGRGKESGVASSDPTVQSGHCRHRFEDYAEVFVRIAAIQRKRRSRLLSIVRKLIRKFG